MGSCWPWRLNIVGVRRRWSSPEDFSCGPRRRSEARMASPWLSLEISPSGANQTVARTPSVGYGLFQTARRLAEGRCSDTGAAAPADLPARAGLAVGVLRREIPQPVRE